MKTSIVLSFAGLLGAAGIVIAQDAGPVAPPPPTAKIVSVVGDALLSGAGLPPNKRAEAGDELRNATRILARTPETVVQLECANGGTQTLQDGFVAIINRAGAPSQCAIALRAGTALATSSPDGGEAGKASVDGGPIAAESGHTQFGVTVPREDPGNSEAFVIEGEATVKRAGETQVLKDGQMLSARVWAVSAVSEARYQSVARNLARVDLQRSGVVANPAAQTELAQKYYAALRAPEDGAARAALTSQYSALKIPESSLTKYNAVRLKRLDTYKVAPQSQLSPQAEAPQAHAPAAPGHFAVAAGAANFAAAARVSTFANPTVNNYRLDLCLHWGMECGWPAANEFCKSKGFSGAAEYARADDIGAQSPTLVMGDNKVCGDATCDGFASIRCQ